MNSDYKAGFKAGYKLGYESPDCVDFYMIVQGAKNLARDNSATQAGLFIYLTHIENDGFNYRSETGMLIVYFKVGVIILLPNKMIEIVYTGK